MSNAIRSLRWAVLVAAIASAVASQASAQQTRTERAPAAGVVNIQTATPDQLQLLPGIGPAKAAAIVAYRDQHAFHHVEEIMRVRGIGRATFRRLRPMLTVEGPTTMTEQASAPRREAPAEPSEEL